MVVVRGFEEEDKNVVIKEQEKKAEGKVMIEGDEEQRVRKEVVQGRTGEREKERNNKDHRQKWKKVN